MARLMFQTDSWSFALHALPGDHWAAVALCPPSAVVDADGVSLAARMGGPLAHRARRCCIPVCCGAAGLRLCFQGGVHAS